MVIESGLIIFLGLIFIFLKMPKLIALRMLGHPLALDIGVAALAYAIHWGTFTGVMAAAFAGMMTSIFTSIGRRLFGFIEDGLYYPGFIKIDISK